MRILAAWRRAGAHLAPGVVVLGAALPAESKPDWIRSNWITGTFVYADLCTAVPSGARVGQRVTLRRSPNGDGLVYENPSGPVAAGTMTVDDATRTITFAVETGAGPVRFQGVAAPDALTGTLSDEAGAHPVHLPRVLRSHAHEACRDESTGSIGPER